jgi:hypothetical protein
MTANDAIIIAGLYTIARNFAPPDMTGLTSFE